MKIILLFGLLFLALTQGCLFPPCDYNAIQNCEGRVELVQFQDDIVYIKEILASGKEEESKIPKGLKGWKETIARVNGNCCWYFYRR